MARDAHIAFYDVGKADSELVFPIDLERDMFMWAFMAGARVHSNSWGGGSIDNTYGLRGAHFESRIFLLVQFFTCRETFKNFVSGVKLL